MNEDSLIASGFRRGSKALHEVFDRQWWHTSSDDIGKKFCVSVREWRFPDRVGWDAETYFKDSMGEQFSVNLNDVSKRTPGEVVAAFEKLWERLDCQHFELHDRNDGHGNGDYEE